MEGFTNGSVAIFKEIFDQVQKSFMSYWIVLLIRRHNVHYIYYLYR